MKAELTAFIIHLEKNQRRTSNTIKAYYYDVKLLLDHAVKLDFSAWQDVTHEVLLGYLAGLKAQGYKTNTLQHKGICFHLFFEYLRQKHGVVENPAEKLIPGHQGRTKQVVLPQNQVHKLIKTARQIPRTGARDALLIELLYATRLNVHDLVSFTAKSLVAGEALSGLAPVVVELLNPEAADLWQRYCRTQVQGERADQPLFTITERQVNNILKNVSERAGVFPPVTPMSLKYSFLIHQQQVK